ncbi:acetyl-CoA carboxylase biotin carboxyl carrier protein [Butyrivibrio sp. XPD2006]|uniref:acetyl-CoA carboxylase biotin carboxyl carrier protein n=1 Tax=Butyrivibrio sp. XPD2006 TaxID=1280668 RepID=UPI0003B5A13B|nr:acetyl-CoA carboxylase biotin carboxyl carrier protein subunit [Butyrivibrio sp. XPD2006]
MTNSLKDYEEIFERLSLTELDVQEGDFKLKLKREMTSPQSPAPVPISVQTPLPSKEPEQATSNKVITGVEVKAPLLGVFYGAVGDKKAIEVGDKVSKGDVLCTLEAMKMMNEVKAPVDGTVTEVNAGEGDLVEFDQVLFVIE